ncbi:MAG: exodeoxyribonuclease III [Clostridia bacterium]
MKIVSYNINGIRASQKIGLVEWLKSYDADIYCLQEVRANEEICKQILGDIGYNIIYNCGQRAGYSGTVVLTKVLPTKVELGMGEIDIEGRTITLFFNDYVVVNSYVPNGAKRLQYKLDYFTSLTNYLTKLAKNNKIIVCGDTNIAHTEQDLSHPKQCSHVSSFLPIEREALSNLLNQGFIDTFRHKNPDSKVYSWRSYKSRTLNSDFGWKFRFDYIIVNNNLIENVISSDILELEYSDHLPIIVEYNH